MQIEDGKGTGLVAGVSKFNLLETQSVTQPVAAWHAKEGRKFNIVTSILNIDDSDDNAVLYIKNNEPEDFVITGYGIMLGTSTGGAGGEWNLRSVRNPTGGSIVSAGAPITPINFNSGSAIELLATCLEKAAANQTLTGGTDPWLATLGVGLGLQLVNVGTLIIAPGTAFGLIFKDQPLNTSRNVQAFAIGHRHTIN